MVRTSMDGPSLFVNISQPQNGHRQAREKPCCFFFCQRDQVDTEWTIAWGNGCARQCLEPHKASVALEAEAKWATGGSKHPKTVNLRQPLASRIQVDPSDSSQGSSNGMSGDSDVLTALQLVQGQELFVIPT